MRDMVISVIILFIFFMLFSCVRSKFFELDSVLLFF